MPCCIMPSDHFGCSFGQRGVAFSTGRITRVNVGQNTKVHAVLQRLHRMEFGVGVATYLWEHLMVSV